VVWYVFKPLGTAFTIEVSVDGKEFTEVDAGALAGRGTNTMLRAFAPVDARYVRIGIDGGANLPSLYEVGIHGTADEEKGVEAR
jgi:hypothetical protein